MQLDEIAETFELLGDWEQRYQYLIELGEGLPVFPEHLKT
ncbi:MAG: SufE family protein, partial [Gammaproteobacteria bacterium]